MQIGVPRETRARETRVAATPKTVGQLVALGYDVVVERGAGEASSFSDEAYVVAGARVVTTEDAWASEIVHKVNAPADAEVAMLRPGAVLVSLLSPALNPDLVVLRISDFGQNGPLRDRDATPLIVQAASGWVNNRHPGRPPVQAGGRISEYVAGGYGALAALTALRSQHAKSTGVVEVDVSVLESLLSTLPYPMLLAEKMKNLGMPANTRSAPMQFGWRACVRVRSRRCETSADWFRRAFRR